MSPKTKQSERHVEAVLKALDILDCFLDSPSMSMKDIVTATGSTWNRIMRLTGTLVHKGYLIRERSGNFLLGPKAMALGSAFGRNQNLGSLVRPFLQKLVIETGESCSFFVREGLYRVVLLREEGTASIRLSINVGHRTELYAGAAGKVLLAYSPKEILEAIFERNLIQKLTDTTLTEIDSLQCELEKVRRQGFAISLGERNPDAHAVAAPVFDISGEIVGALCVAGPLNRFDSIRREKYLALVVEAAAQLSALLGCKND